MPWKGVATGAVLCVALAGCRQDMHQAPRYDPLEKSDFFADRRASRTLVEGTVPRGFLHEDKVFYTGKNRNAFVDEIPMTVDRALIERGQQRFNIYCSPCHGRTGEGNGMIVQRGYKQPPSYHSDRLRAQPVGYFFDVITNGFGAMPDYAAQVAPADRWAVAAYIRTLQFSRHAPVADITDADRSRVDKGGEPEPPASHGGAASHE